jgi:hypothetical protein
MKHESYVTQQEVVPEAEVWERQELDPSGKEVIEIIAKDAERIEADGQYELEGLSEGLPENDPRVISTREHLLSIARRAKELPKWAATALALSIAQPAVADETPQPEETEIIVTASAKPYKLERDNPQREGYSTPEGYRKYLDDAWETARGASSG